MVCACIIAIALSLAGTPSASYRQQDSADKPSPPASQSPPSTDAPQQQTPPKSQEPSKSDQPETPPTNQEQVPQNETPQEPKGSALEQKKTSPCTEQKNGKCANGRTAKPRKVVRHGSTGEPTAQLAPGMTAEQALHHREATEQLVSTTEGNLAELAQRNLNQNQQDTVSQIRNYLAGSRSALKDGDLLRARTLAFKAHLLADDLLKH